jgi:hypothetical protein
MVYRLVATMEESSKVRKSDIPTLEREASDTMSVGRETW